MKTIYIRLYQDDGGCWADLLDPGDGSGCPPPDGWQPVRLADALPPALRDSQQTLLDAQPQHESLDDLHPVCHALCDFLFGPHEARNALFEQWFACWQQATDAGEALRTVLHLAGADEAVRSAPWELMREEESGLYLAAMTRAPAPTLVRTGWGPTPFALPPVPLKPSEPLRLLVVVGFSAEESLALGGLDEMLRIDEAFFKLLPWRVDLHVLPRATKQETMAWCQKWQPHIFHFIGHGEMVGDEPILLLQEDTGDKRLRPDELKDAFDKGCPQLVVLNACRSGQAGSAENAARAVQGFTQKLLGLGVLAVITMQANVQGEAAAFLMGKFYAGLANGRPLDRALTEARLGERQRASDAWDWALPTLYVARGKRVEDVLPLEPPALACRPTVFPDTFDREGVPGLAWPVALQITVGYDDEHLRLENQFLKPGTPNAIPPITLLSGETDSGKSTLVFWLSERCARAGHPFLYADFAGESLDFWDALRLIRDGYLGDDASGIALQRPLAPPNVSFNRFNHLLNRKLLPDYDAPPPDDDTPVPDGTHGIDSERRLAELGRVTAGENVLQTISDAFWADLTRAAGSSSLILFLDHVDDLPLNSVQLLRSHLVDRVLAPDSPVRLVLTQRRNPWDDGNSPWAFLTSDMAYIDRVVEVPLLGLPRRDLKWLARVWAYRYFFRTPVPSRQYLKGVVLYLKSQMQQQHEEAAALLDAYVARRLQGYEHYHGQHVQPGSLVQELLARQWITDWLRELRAQG